MQTLLDFLHKLKAQHIYYRLSDHTGDAIMVEIAVPGERWEVEFFADGGIQVEVFVARGSLEAEPHKALDELFARESE